MALRGLRISYLDPSTSGKFQSKNLLYSLNTALIKMTLDVLLIICLVSMTYTFILCFGVDCASP